MKLLNFVVLFNEFNRNNNHLLANKLFNADLINK